MNRVRHADSHANVGPDDAGGRTATEERSAAAAEHESREPDQRLLRALADLDNLRKRYARELEREQRAERSRVAAQWLPVVDDLERALIYADEHDDPLAQGLRAVYEHALTVLARLGYPRFEDAGRLFDPVRHESVGVVE